ncbi:hypothetical protein [Brumimicrobium sp.]|uniref:hypothetical protein n=1 Tax=Brumimicrobium sp. TaxID=2029867 RepID=UPI0026038121|nr:hypothetical protein [uncultured Brumimicrobium sp.]
MRLLSYSTKLYAFIFLLIPFFSAGQIETSLVGEYTVSNGGPVDRFVISSEKVEAFANTELAEKYFFYAQEEQTYILEQVKLNVESIDPTINKDRKLIRVNLTELSPGVMQVDIHRPNGTTQELTMTRNE